MFFTPWLKSLYQRRFQSFRRRGSRIGTLPTRSAWSQSRSAMRSGLKLLEILEPRMLLAAAGLSGGTLSITGVGSADDVVLLSSNGTTITFTNTGNVFTAGPEGTVGLTGIGTNTITVAASALTGELKIDLGDGTDSLTFADGGTFKAVGGFDLKAETITVGVNSTLSTRATSGDLITGTSTAASGDISWEGLTLSLGSGSRLLAHVENGSLLAAGDVILTASDVYSVPPIDLGLRTTNASVTIGDNAIVRGENLLITSAAKDEPLINTDNIPDALNNFLIEPLMNLLTDNLTLPVMVVQKRATSVVSIGANAALVGSGDVVLESTASADATVKAISGGIKGGIPVLQVFSVAYSEAFVTATTTLNANATVAAGGSVSLLSHTDTTVSATARTTRNLGGTAPNDQDSLAFAVAVTNGKTTSRAVVADGAQITSGRNVDVRADGTISNEATAATASYEDGLLGIAVATEFNTSDITAVVNGKITAAGSTATQDLSFRPFSGFFGIPLVGPNPADTLDFTEAQLLGLQTGDAVRYSTNDTSAIGGLVDGHVYYVIRDQAEPGKIKLAESYSDAVDGSEIDLGIIDGGLSLSLFLNAQKTHTLTPINGINVSSRLDTSDVSSAGAGERGDPLVTNALSQGEVSGFAPLLINGGFSKLRSKMGDISSLSENGTSVSIAASVAYAQTDNRAETRIGDHAELTSQTDLTIDASLSAALQTVCESTVSQREDENADDAISAAVIVALYDNTARAIVGNGAKLDARDHLAITSHVELPYLTDPLDLITSEDFSSIEGLAGFLDGKLGIQSKIFNTWARSTATSSASQAGGKGFGITASVSYTDYDNISEAILGGGLTFDTSEIESSNTLAFRGPHGFRQGDEVKYSAGGGTPVGGLIDGQTYFVILDPASPSKLKLASSTTNATAGTAITLDKSVATGVGHTRQELRERSSIKPSRCEPSIKMSRSKPTR